VGIDISRTMIDVAAELVPGVDVPVASASNSPVGGVFDHVLFDEIDIGAQSGLGQFAG